MQAHSDRKHSKYSASGAERWEACPGSVELSEGQPDKDSPWAIEGTTAHEAHEAMLIALRDGKAFEKMRGWTSEMLSHAKASTGFIVDLWKDAPGSDLMVETRIALDFIHPEMFGTFDAAVVDYFGTLNVFDFKYGAGHAVGATENLQMAFYGIGLAHKYDWNFKRIRHWIIQPRIRGYDGPMFWEVPTIELKTKWVDRFKRAVDRVEAEPDTYVEGSWCHWCKAKKICPLKVEGRNEKAKSIFTPVGGEHGSKKVFKKSEADWRKEASGSKGHRQAR